MDNGIFKVVIHYGNDYGFIMYNAATKQAQVTLANDQKRREVEQYLVSKHLIRSAVNTLRDFTESEFAPVESTDKLKLALTRMWEKTGVYVDWSRPA